MKKLDSLARADYLTKLGLYDELVPEVHESFREFAKASFADGALSTREKEIIAVGCAHVLRCPYCIDYHIALATDAGASRAELAESVWVAIGMGAGACFSHAAVAMRSLHGEKGDYYKNDNGIALGQFAAEVPAAYAAYAEFKHQTFADGVLSADFKQLIAIACAHNTRCPYCIEHHVAESLGNGRSKEEIAEAVWVGIEMGAGACYGHAGVAAALLE